MPKKVGLEGSFAVSEGVKMAKVDVISAYPITPQTHIVERLAEMVADAEIDAEFICVESEHSALSACVGAAATGARVFTCTSGQGLELMHEVVYIVSSMRMPMVMVVANRALSAPLSVWGDHSDVMAVRDVGWIQVFARNAQEAVDLTIWAFRVSEDHNVLFPVMVNLDGFHLTHVVEALEMPEQSQVDKYLPQRKVLYSLNPSKPISMGGYGPPVIYFEAKKAQEVAMLATKETLLKGWKEFEEIFGRHYQPINTYSSAVRPKGVTADYSYSPYGLSEREPVTGSWQYPDKSGLPDYKMDDAETGLFIMGSFAETATIAIDNLYKTGKKVRLITPTLWRPFPFEELRQAVQGLKKLVVVDRAISSGGPGGPVASEIKAALYNSSVKPEIVSFIAGLGGRDITPEHFETMINKAEKGISGEYEMIGVRE